MKKVRLPSSCWTVPSGLLASKMNGEKNKTAREAPVYECLHFTKKKRPRDTRCCALKPNMKKAYDHVSGAIYVLS